MLKIHNPLSTLTTEVLKESQGLGAKDQAYYRLYLEYGYVSVPGYCLVTLAGMFLGQYWPACKASSTLYGLI